jgi:hypothetical protein
LNGNGTGKLFGGGKAARCVLKRLTLTVLDSLDHLDETDAISRSILNLDYSVEHLCGVKAQQLIALIANVEPQFVQGFARLLYAHSFIDHCIPLSSFGGIVLRGFGGVKRYRHKP